MKRPGSEPCGRRRLTVLTRWSVVLAVALVVATVTAGHAAQPGESDLKISKAASVPALPVDQTLTYTIEVENIGPDTASAVLVTDALPRAVEYVSATSSLGSCALQNRKLTCSIGTLEAGPSAKVRMATVTLVVIPRAAGTITNTASVKSEQKDSAGSNNEASVSTNVLAPTPVASCRGAAGSVVGTPGDDVLVGTGGPDVIVGLGGDDTIASRAGRDLICAGKGNDRTAAGSAADRVFGGAGQDRLLGRGGSDLLKGGAGADQLLGGDGADRLRGGRGADICRPGLGADSVSGCER